MAIHNQVFDHSTWEQDWLDFDERVWPFFEAKGFTKPDAFMAYTMGNMIDLLLIIRRHVETIAYPDP